ncbi:MAG: SpoIID/LytB domain-containing protein [Oscillospiraceae bacterium]
MKKFIGIFAFLLVINLLVPVIYYKLYSGLNLPDRPMVEEELSQEPSPPSKIKKSTVTLYDEGAKTTVEIPLIDYLVGAAACEMPASYEAEAIKAQMVAIHSYYEYVQLNPTYLSTEYITFNEGLMKGYASKLKLQDYWQMNFDEYYQKYLRCANEVAQYVAQYNGKPILAAYHAVSCGNTQSSGAEWGMELPYLVCVDSGSDGVSDDYLKMRSYDIQEMYDRLTTSFAGLNLDIDKPQEWFGEIEYNSSGYADYINVGGVKIEGRQLRKQLQLPSSCMMIFLEDGTFSIATKGYGHGVGLSQFGANELSKSGKKYDEILSHFYTGISLAEI